MKNILKYATMLLLAGFSLTGCETETTPERKIVQHPDQQSPIVRDDAYYARLRAYKKTKHKIAFGWFGSWNPANASKMATLTNAPDSMDIISIWSQWHSLTPAQMKDKEFVQKVKGTKVTYTIFAHEVPEPFLVEGEVTPEGLAAYAKAYAKDSMDKYRYDGIDLDYEPGFGGVGPLVGHNNENMKIFCQELSKWVGPASGTGRLLLIDGVPYALHAELAKLFDYGIVQAYYSYGYTDLQNRFNNAYNKGWKPEQYIFAEDFEKGWQNGGVNHQLRSGGIVPSLYGMALFDPDQGTGGGFGTYHMEYEYGHNDMVYKYMRRAIQLVNPAPAGDLNKTLVSINEAADMETFEIKQTPSGHLYGQVVSQITGKLSVVPASETSIPLRIDNDFVTAYNAENDTEYSTLDPAAVVISGDLHFPAGEQYTDAPVAISIPGLGTLANGSYMVVVEPDLAGKRQYGINQKAERKILIIDKQQTYIEVSFANAEADFTIISLRDGTIAGQVQGSIDAALSLPALSATDFGLVADAELAAAYNEMHGTEYTILDAAQISLTGRFRTEQGETALSGSVDFAVTSLERIAIGTTIVALRPELSALEDYAADRTNGVKYVLIRNFPENVAAAQNLEEYESKSTLIENTENTLGWQVDIVNLAPVGGNGVWNFNNASMFDGSYSGGWYASYNSPYSWRKGYPDGQVTLDMKGIHTVSTFLWSICYANPGYAVKTIGSIETSIDGINWTRHNAGGVEIATGDDSLQWFTFIDPVETRYVRIAISEGYGAFCGMSEIRVYTPNN